MNKVVVFIILISILHQFALCKADERSVALRVTLLDNCFVTGADISLKDIARIEGDDEALKGELGELKIYRAEKPGSKLTLSASYIKSRVKNYGFPVEEMNWDGPDKVTVQTRATSIGKSELTCSVLEAVKHLIDDQEARVKVFPVSEISPIMLPYGHVQIRVEPVAQSTLTDIVPFKVVMTVDGEERERRIIPFRIDIIRDVVVAQRAIRADSTISESDITVERRKVGLIKIAPNKSEVIGKRATKFIASGTILTPDLLSEPILIKRGDIVTMVFESKTLRITAEGKALESGSLGQLIKVINTTSMKELTAKVVGERTVELSF